MTGTNALWQPRPSAVPLEEYAFADREEHERAFAWAAQLGPQPGMPAADILPPLPHPIDLLFASAVALSHCSWRDIPLGIPDPRAPWREDSLNGRVRSLDRRFLLVQPYGGLGVEGAMQGWKATLLTVEEPEIGNSPKVTELTLVQPRPRLPVRFGDRLEAERMLTSLFFAGVLPFRWTWDRVAYACCPWRSARCSRGAACQRSTMRRDGLERAWSALEHVVGSGIAACTMGALERLRAGLGGLMREHWIRCDGPPRRD